MMKHFFALLTAFLLMFTPAMAEAIQEDALLIVAEQLAQEVDLAASSPAYLGVFSPSNDIVAQLEAWGAGDHANPTAVYRITFGEDYFADLFKLDELSPLLSVNWQNRYTVAVMTQLNARHGAQAIAASSSVQIGTALLGTVENCIYILCYEEGADVAVCFSPVDGGLSNATALFLADKFAQETLENVLDATLTVEKLR